MVAVFQINIFAPKIYLYVVKKWKRKKHVYQILCRLILWISSSFTYNMNSQNLVCSEKNHISAEAKCPKRGKGVGCSHVGDRQTRFFG